MEQELRILDDRKVLFHDELYIKEIYWGEEVNLNRTKLLYIPSNTSAHFQEESERKGFLQRLSIMKSAITDQRIPSSVVNFGEEVFTYEDCDQADILPWEEHYGRDEILKLVEKYHFREAFLEVRQVVLKDLCPYLKTIAISTITSLGGKEAAETLCEKLRDTSEFILVREAAAMGLKAFSFSESIKPLIDTFHETAYTCPLEFYAKEKVLLGAEDFDYQVNQKLYRREWMPLLCLDALSNIPRKESLQTLEQAVKVGVPEIAEQARDSIIHWIDVKTKIVSEQIRRVGLTPEIQKRVDGIKKLIYTYDITSKTKFYDTSFGRIRGT